MLQDSRHIVNVKGNGQVVKKITNGLPYLNGIIWYNCYVLCEENSRERSVGKYGMER